MLQIIYQENRTLYNELKEEYKKIRSSKSTPSIKNCSITVSNEMFSLLCQLPDLDEAEMKTKSNFVKKVKRGQVIRGVNIEEQMEKLEV